MNLFLQWFLFKWQRAFHFHTTILATATICHTVWGSSIPWFFRGREICSPKDLTSRSVWITTSLMHLLLNWLFLFDETSVYIFIASSSWSLPQATAGVFNLEVWTWQIFFINDLLWFFTDVWYTWWIIDPVILAVLCWYQASQYDCFLVASSMYATLFSSHCILFFGINANLLKLCFIQ